MKIMLKEAKKEDAAKYYELYEQLRGFVEKGGKKPSFNEFQTLFLSLIENSSYRLLRIENRNSETVGVIVISSRDNLFHCKKIIYIDEIVIEQKYRGLGYGKESLLELKKYYKEKGDTVKIELSTDYNNTPARAFYDNVGFEDYAALYKMKIM